MYHKSFEYTATIYDFKSPAQLAVEEYVTPDFFALYKYITIFSKRLRARRQSTLAPRALLIGPFTCVPKKGGAIKKILRPYIGYGVDLRPYIGYGVALVSRID